MHEQGLQTRAAGVRPAWRRDAAGCFGSFPAWGVIGARHAGAAIGRLPLKPFPSWRAAGCCAPCSQWRQLACALLPGPLLPRPPAWRDRASLQDCLGRAAGPGGSRRAGLRGGPAAEGRLQVCCRCEAWEQALGAGFERERAPIMPSCIPKRSGAVSDTPLRLPSPLHPRTQTLRSWQPVNVTVPSRPHSLPACR